MRRLHFDRLEERTVLNADLVNFVMPYDGTVYMTFDHGEAGASTDFGIGHSISDAKFVLFGMPSAHATIGEQAAGTFHAGEVVPFAMRTFWGSTWYAFSGDTTNFYAQEAFLDRSAGGVVAIQQTSPTTWLLKMDDAASSDDDDNDVVVQLRIERAILNQTPTTSGIPNQSCDEDGAISLVLGSYFADDGSLSFSVVADSNPSLFSSVDIVDGRLNLGLYPNAYGESSLTVRATDSAGLFVEDTFLLTARQVNDAPVGLGIPDVSVDEDARPFLIDLGSLFTDIDDPILSYSVQTNDNAKLLSANIADGKLKLDFLPNQNGTASLMVRATDSSGAFVDSSFSVVVKAVNDAPTALGLPNITVKENAKSTIIDLNGKFADVDDASLKFTAFSDNKLCSATIIDGKLTLELARNASGVATIVVRATDAAGAFVESKFSVTVEPRQDDNKHDDKTDQNNGNRDDDKIRCQILPINAALATQASGGIFGNRLIGDTFNRSQATSRTEERNSERSFPQNVRPFDDSSCKSDQTCRSKPSSMPATNQTAEKPNDAAKVRDAAIEKLGNNRLSDISEMILKDVVQRSSDNGKLATISSSKETTTKGNNGVGNGQDPAPAGQPKENDGAGAAPGNPGNKGGKKS